MPHLSLMCLRNGYEISREYEEVQNEVEYFEVQPNRSILENNNPTEQVANEHDGKPERHEEHVDQVPPLTLDRPTHVIHLPASWVDERKEWVDSWLSLQTDCDVYSKVSGGSRANDDFDGGSWMELKKCSEPEANSVEEWETFMDCTLTV
ncbi:hypothetical protein HHK36_003808 [Tetracentron sinense]|uniref:Uncharacterized protein n=1 Tax=Tetracentron sinense TaxID=13715 RepID=A0A834ZYL4_TETSI|nr:hypothetical protein HHK36_003808 [Tetracentron sinense]